MKLSASQGDIEMCFALDVHRTCKAAVIAAVHPLMLRDEACCLRFRHAADGWGRVELADKGAERDVRREMEAKICPQVDQISRPGCDGTIFEDIAAGLHEDALDVLFDYMLLFLVLFAPVEVAFMELHGSGERNGMEAVALAVKEDFRRGDEPCSGERSGMEHHHHARIKLAYALEKRAHGSGVIEVHGQADGHGLVAGKDELAEVAALYGSMVGVKCISICLAWLRGCLGR